MELGPLKKTAENARRRFGRPGISCRASPGASVEALLLAGTPIEHGQIRTSTVGRLERRGFVVERTGDPWHVTVWLGDAVLTDDRLDELVRLFDAPEPNPILPGDG